jgi:hypothetical protein
MAVARDLTVSALEDLNISENSPYPEAVGSKRGFSME